MEEFSARSIPFDDDRPLNLQILHFQRGCDVYTVLDRAVDRTRIVMHRVRAPGSVALVRIEPQFVGHVNALDDEHAVFGLNFAD